MGKQHKPCYSADEINPIETILVNRLTPMLPSVKSGDLPSQAALEAALADTIRTLEVSAILATRLLEYNQAQALRKGITLKFRDTLPLRLRKFHDSLWDKLDSENPTIAKLDLTHAK